MWLSGTLPSYLDEETLSWSIHFCVLKKSVYVVLHICLYIIHQPQIQVQCLSVILLTAESILLVF